MSEKLDFVNVQRDRDGVVRHWYFRRSGRRWPLPGSPYTDAEAAAECWRLHKETSPANEPISGTAQRHGPGSFGVLVRDYSTVHAGRTAVIDGTYRTGAPGGMKLRTPMRLK